MEKNQLYILLVAYPHHQQIYQKILQHHYFIICL